MPPVGEVTTGHSLGFKSTRESINRHALSYRFDTIAAAAPSANKTAVFAVSKIDNTGKETGINYNDIFRQYGFVKVI